MRAPRCGQVLSNATISPLSLNRTISPDKPSNLMKSPSLASSRRWQARCQYCSNRIRSSVISELPGGRGIDHAVFGHRAHHDGAGADFRACADLQLRQDFRAAAEKYALAGLHVAGQI